MLVIDDKDICIHKQFVILGKFALRGGGGCDIQGEVKFESHL